MWPCQAGMEPFRAKTWKALVSENIILHLYSVIPMAFAGRVSLSMQHDVGDDFEGDDSKCC